MASPKATTSTAVPGRNMGPHPRPFILISLLVVFSALSYRIGMSRGAAVRPTPWQTQHFVSSSACEQFVDSGQSQLFLCKRHCPSPSPTRPSWAHLPTPNHRMIPSGVSGGRITCWPSTGGIWSKDCSAAELEWLGLPRFDSVDKPSQYNGTDEDLLCNKIRMLGGAKFWKIPFTDDSYYHWAHEIVCNKLEDCHTPDVVEQWVAGIDEDNGGIWLLETDNGDVDLELRFGGLGNSFSMKERCRVIEKAGGVFHKHEDVDSTKVMEWMKEAEQVTGGVDVMAGKKS